MSGMSSPRSDPTPRIDLAGTVLCEPEWSWHPTADRMRDFDLWFVWSGRGEMLADGRKIPLAPGSVFCLRPGHAYHATHDPAHRLGVCYLHFDYVDHNDQPARPPEREWPPHHCTLDPVEFHEQTLRHAVMFSTGDALRRRQAAMLLSSVLLAMRWEANQPRRSPIDCERERRLAPVLRRIREHPGEMFSMRELADRAGYGIDHFTRVFRQVTGTSPKEFCIRARIDRAKQLLRESTLSIEQIAQAMGYADLFFFSRQFKQRTGVPPTHWRRE